LAFKQRIGTASSMKCIDDQILESRLGYCEKNAWWWCSTSSSSEFTSYKFWFFILLQHSACPANIQQHNESV